MVKPENLPGTRFEGIHDIPSVGGAFSTDEHAPDVFALVPKPSEEHLSIYKNRDDQDLDAQILTDWTPEEENEILAPIPKESKSKEASKKENNKSTHSEDESQKESDIKAALNKIF